MWCSKFLNVTDLELKFPDSNINMHRNIQGFIQIDYTHGEQQILAIYTISRFRTYFHNLWHLVMLRTLNQILEELEKQCFCLPACLSPPIVVLLQSERILVFQNRSPGPEYFSHLTSHVLSSSQEILISEWSCSKTVYTGRSSRT